MNCTRVFPRGVDPGFKHLKDEEIVLACQTCVDDSAFEIGITLGDERRLDTRCRYRRKANFFERVHASAGGVPATYSLCRELHCRDIDHAFLCRLQYAESKVLVADHAAHDGGSKSIIVCHDMVTILARPI